MKLIFFRRPIIGLICGAITTVAVLFFSALFLSSREDPTKGLELLSQLSLFAGAFVCGKVSCIGVENRLPSAISAAAICTLALLLPCLILSPIGANTAIKVVLVAVFAFTGAMIRKRQPSRRTKSNRRKNVVRRYAR